MMHGVGKTAVTRNVDDTDISKVDVLEFVV